MTNRDNLDRLIDRIRFDLNKDLPIQHLSLLLKVAARPGITMAELVDELDMPQGTVSRNVKALGIYRKKLTEADKAAGKLTPELGGYDLVFTTTDLENRKSLAIHLTARGQQLVRNIDDVLLGKPINGPIVDKISTKTK